ncbi:hypothetical protein [Erwinia rhapontici]|nr:hypothetical protein [Erwinia rhapontici]
MNKRHHMFEREEQFLMQDEMIVIIINIVHISPKSMSGMIFTAHKK